MYLSDYLGAGVKGHYHFDFIDICLDSDNRLFIDPCMLEGANDPWSRNATFVMRTFFDRLFEELRAGILSGSTLLWHATEQNATKLGYGNGENGKGKTAEGFWESIRELSQLVHAVPTICRAQDIPVLVHGFAEDCMSDLLTNILHEPLNSFTYEQMLSWGCPPQGIKRIWTFDAIQADWIQVDRPCWFYRGKEVLLVPKWVVRGNYLFKAHQYLYSIIIERIRKDNGWDDLRKIDIWENLPRSDINWEYNMVKMYSIEHPDALAEYHDRMPQFYRRAHGCMSDDELDRAIYGQGMTKYA